MDAHNDDHREPRERETPDDGAPVGGDETTEDQLEADNEVEADQLRTLDPDDTPA